MANINDLKEKCEVEVKALKALETKKKDLDEKVAKKRRRVEELRLEIQRLEYAELELKLQSHGLSRESLLNALTSGDLSALQKVMESTDTVEAESVSDDMATLREDDVDVIIDEE